MTRTTCNRSFKHPVPGMSGRRNMLLLATLLMLLVSVAVPMRAFAQNKGCYRIDKYTESKNSPYYTQPGTDVRYWDGATSDYAGTGAYPMTVNISGLEKEGTLLGSAIAPTTNLGFESYSPEQVLFRCSPDADMYEYYSTNGDSDFAGKYDVSKTSGVDGTFRSNFAGIAFRVTNMTNGAIVRRIWAGRQLTGLDKDDQGWFLVKVKNFSSYKLELFKCTECRSEDQGWVQPYAYVAFSGGSKGGNQIDEGLRSNDKDHVHYFPGWYRPSSWPGAINRQGSIIVRRAATCQVTTVTPLIYFPTMTVTELQAGGSRQIPIKIDMQCQRQTPPNPSGTRRLEGGTNANQTALGILVQPPNAQSAIQAGLKTEGSGVRYLLSDGYGTDPNIATGVGVALSEPNGAPLNFLTNEYVTMGGGKDGWSNVSPDGSFRTRTINTSFRAFAPGAVPVTVGKFRATAQVIIRVQ